MRKLTCPSQCTKMNIMGTQTHIEPSIKKQFQKQMTNNITDYSCETDLKGTFSSKWNINIPVKFCSLKQLHVQRDIV